MELRGQSIVLVDGCCGLLVYGQDEIEISVLGGKRMCIFGEKLTLSYMSPEKNRRPRYRDGSSLCIS